MRLLIVTLVAASALSSTSALAQSGRPPPPPESATPTLARAYVIASTANLRAAPQPDAAIVRKLPIATTVRVRKREGEWIEVVVGADVKSGYLLASLVSDDEPTLPKMLARHDALPASDVNGRAVWAERAAALAPRDVGALTRLVAILEKRGDAKALAYAREELAHANGTKIADEKGLQFFFRQELAWEAYAAPIDLATTRGRLFALTSAGVLSLHLQTKKWTALWFDGSANVGGEAAIINGHAIDASPTSLWIVDNNGVMRLDVRGERALRVADGSECGSPPGRGPLVTRIAAIPDGAWLSCSNGALLFVDEAGAPPRLVSPAPSGGAPLSAPLLAADGDDVWLMRGDKLSRFDRRSFAQKDEAAASPPDVHLESGATGIRASACCVFAAAPTEVRRYDKSKKTWTTLPTGGHASGIIDEDHDLMWVGASYDVSPASLFAIRYMKDFKKEAESTLVVFSHFNVTPRLKIGADTWFTTAYGLLKWRPGSLEAFEYRPRSVWAPGKALLTVPETRHDLSRIGTHEDPFLPASYP